MRLFLSGADTVHVVTDRPRVYTLSLAGLASAAAPIELPTYRAAPNRRIDHRIVGQAAITADGGFIVTNRYERTELGVADLGARRGYTVTVRNVTVTGGVAINRADVNKGLLALHAGSQVVVYRFSPPTVWRNSAASPFRRPTPPTSATVSPTTRAAAGRS